MSCNWLLPPICCVVISLGCSPFSLSFLSTPQVQPHGQWPPPNLTSWSSYLANWLRKETVSTRWGSLPMGKKPTAHSFMIQMSFQLFCSVFSIFCKSIYQCKWHDITMTFFCQRSNCLLDISRCLTRRVSLCFSDRRGRWRRLHSVTSAPSKSSHVKVSVRTWKLSGSSKFLFSLTCPDVGGKYTWVSKIVMKASNIFL